MAHSGNSSYNSRRHSEADVTILVPTKNRVDFVARLLRFYADHRFAGVVCLADASTNGHSERVQETVRAFGDRLAINHLRLPGVHTAASLQQAGDEISTPFVAFSGDDDFLIPDGLRAAVSGLDEDQSLSAAHGSGVVVTLASPGAYGSVTATRPYRQPIVNASTARERLLDHLSNYGVTLFSVHRINVWRAMFKDVLTITDADFRAEMLPCCLSVVYGNVREVGGLSLVRQDHDARHVSPAVLDWIAHEDWAESYQRFSAVIARAVAQEDGITIEEAQKAVAQAFSAFLSRRFNRESELNAAARSRALPARLVASASSRLRTLMRRFASRAGTVSLEELRQASSPHYAQFDRVYQAMTGSRD